MDGRLVVTLLRHGLTEENERSAYIGWTDCPLSQKGRQLVHSVAKIVHDAHVVFSSPLIRSLETAKILFPNETIIPIDDLKEMYFGKWEGKTYEQLKDVPAYRDWLDHPFMSSPDGGESFTQFGKRIESGWDKIVQHVCETEATNVVVVTHGGVIRYLLSYLLKKERSFFEWDVPVGSGYRLIWQKQLMRGRERCTLLQEVPIMESLNG